MTSLKGGKGSGNFGHEGRPGQRGGSADDEIGNTPPSSRGVPASQQPLFRASPHSTLRPSPPSHSALGSGVYFANSRESASRYQGDVRQYQATGDLLEIQGDADLDKYRALSSSWAESRLQGADLSKVENYELYDPSVRLSRYIQSLGFVGIKYNQIDPENDHHSQVVIYDLSVLTEIPSTKSLLPLIVRSALALDQHGRLDGVTKMRVVKALESSWNLEKKKSGSANDGHNAAGLLVASRETGRVLMIQRALDETDPHSGEWEFPGGRIEPGETPLEAAKREWMEETGYQLPQGRVVGTWDCGGYVGYVYSVGLEGDIQGLRDRVINPDDPDRDKIEALAWWDVDQLRDNPAVREEVRSNLALMVSALDGFELKGGKGSGNFVHRAREGESSSDGIDFTPDLALWEKRVLHLLDQGRKPNPRPFKSDTIPEEIKSLIEDGLELVMTKSDVKSLFEFVKGGEGSGNFGHKGRPGEVGGSSSSSEDPHDVFNTAPVGPASKAKKWRKGLNQRYQTDRSFKMVADVASLYTQGEYSVIRAFSQYVVAGTLPPEYEDSMIPTWIKDNFSMSAMSNPLGDYDVFFEGQNLDNDGLRDVSALEAAAEFQKAIAESDPLEHSVYRGVSMYGTNRKKEDGKFEWETEYVPAEPPKVGDSFDILGTSSFSANLTVAEDFAFRRAKGQRKGDVSTADFVAIYEIAPGGTGLNVSSMSPWNQEEFVVSGRYRVKEVIPFETGVLRSRYSRKVVPGYRIVLEQIGVWDVDVTKFQGKPVKRSYAKDD